MYPAILLLLAVASRVAAQPAIVTGLEVLTVEGTPLAQMPVPHDTEVCLHWQHSVTFGKVIDCFVIQAGQMILTRSYLHDFAAGLGHLPERGQQRPAERGGYWIEAINEAVPGNRLLLRVGSPQVGHRLHVGNRMVDLSAVAAGQRLILRPMVILDG